MSKKKIKKKKTPKPTAPSVRLSQCMIVKNEEKNIEKALGWAKGLAFEQIVVDTGSTDRTVELAEKLGAKVFHFEWIDDFSAAKNHAINQATGNWIAFLDADEYFSPEDAKKMMAALKRLQGNRDGRIQAVVSPLVNLDDNNVPISVQEQCRLFRNQPDIRYVGRIHENPTITGEILNLQDFTVMHTGYSKAVSTEKEKNLDRTRMNREELARSPGDPNLMIYLASSLTLPPTNEENLAEADRLNREALDGRPGLHPGLKQKAYITLLDDYINKPERIDDFEYYCKAALKDFPGDLDFTYCYGALLKKKEDYKGALKTLKKCEGMFLGTDELAISYIIQLRPARLFLEIAEVAQILGDVNDTVHYLTIALQLEKYHEIILPKYLVTLKDLGASDEELVSLLGSLYDYSSVKDKAFLLQAACAANNEGFFDMIKSMVTEEERSGSGGLA